MAGILGLLMSGAGLIKDQYFNLTTLLLPGNGTNGAQNNTFLDSSTNNFTITRNGNTTQGTFSPFSQTGWANYFDGNGDYLSVPDNVAWDFPGDFTIETWIYLNGTGQQHIYEGRVGSTTNALLFYLNASTQPAIYINGSVVMTGSSALTTGQWYHLVATRLSNTLYLFVNGNSVATPVSNSTSIVSPGSIYIGSNDATSGGFINGYLSGYRVLKGTGYSSVTVPTSPPTAITNTQLLTCQSNRFRDASTNNFTITANGNTSVVAFSPFAPTAAYTTAAVGGSGYFDGTGDYVEAPNSTNLDVGTGDFSIEAWCYKTNTSTATDWRVAGGSALSSGFFGDGGTASSRGFGIGRTGVAWDVTSNVQAPIYEWFHICYTRKSGDVRIFLNGKLIAYAAGNTNNYGLNAGTLQIAAGQGAQTLTGYMTGFRLFKTVPASYDTTVTTINTQVFTPPTSPPTAITNTQLLLNFTNAGITDATAKNDLETVGNAQISTSVSKFGGGSIAFDGTGDYLLIPPIPVLEFGSGDFTIEFWFYSNSISTYQTLMERRSSVTVGGLVIGIYLSAIAINVGDTNTSAWEVAINGSSLSSSTWYHVAFTRSGSSWKLFVNGTQQGSTATWSGTPAFETSALRIAGDASGANCLNGYMDDIRITKGYARYTSNFTAPTAPFPVQ